MEDWVWFALLFAAGFFAYSVFGMQISIMRKCGQRVYWLLSGGEAFDGDGCRKYMRKVIWTNLVILLVLDAVVIWLVPRGGPGGFNWGIVFGYLIAGGKAGCNTQNVKEAGEAFKKFVRPGYEERIANILEETQKNPDVLYTIQKPEKTAGPKQAGDGGTVPAWLLVAVCCVAVAIVVYLLGVYVPGIREESQGNYDSAYQRGYTAGKAFQREQDIEGLTVGNKNLKTLVTLVESQYGVGPREAYDLVMDYADQGANSGYCYDEYENALEAILYFAELVPDGD